MKFSILSCTLLLTSSAFACLNDRDTLRQAQGRFPDVIDIVTGRFDRNPPLYYQMRIDRLIPLVAKDPTNLQNYDDIGVAYDKLGNDTAAIQYMKLKDIQLKKLTEVPTYHDYSYHANLGTFLFHDWVAKGSPLSLLSQAEQGVEHIERAIQIKPDAHFGREPVQLHAMEWVIAMKTMNPKKPVELGMMVKDSDKELRGALGLIALGGAWESLDVFYSISQSTRLMMRSRTTQDLATLRTSELYDAGKRSLSQKINSLIRFYQSSNTESQKEFLKLRKNAEEYVAHRQAFMLAKLKAGKHPDTDPKFWEGYTPTPKYSPNGTIQEAYRTIGWPGQFWLWFGVVSAAVVGLFWLRRLRL